MGLKLNITPSGSSSALTMTFCEATVTTATYEGSTLTLVNINFNKQMYQPGEINARIQFTPAISLSNLNKLLNSKVSLDSYDDAAKGYKSVASGYYVHELVPEVSKTEIEDGVRKQRLYVWLKIYSPDKLLTLDRQSRAFTAKRLVRDILQAEADGISLPYNATTKLSSLMENPFENKLYLPVYKTSGNKFVLEAKNNTFVHNDGCIHPYLVQYDESFYDMLIRTANRWGEFVYFEGGKLILGRKSTSSQKTDIKAGYTISYASKNTASAIRDIVSNDEYLEYIKEDDYLNHSGDLFSTPPDDKYGHKVVQSLLNMKGNVFDWVANNGMDALWTASQNDVYINKQNAEYNKTYFPDNSKITDTAAKERLDTQYATVKLEEKAGSVKAAVDALAKALEKAKEIEYEVNKYAGKDSNNVAYTFRDYVIYDNVNHPTGESDALKTALNNLKDAYDKYTTVLNATQLTTKRNAETEVNKLAEEGKTYVDYCDTAKVMIPSDASDCLKDALTDLQNAYDIIEDKRDSLKDEKAKEKTKEVKVYAPFALMGELDDNLMNLSYVSSVVYASVLKNELAAGSESVCVDLDANYQHLCLGDVFKIGSDEYVVTRVECKVDEKDSLETTMETNQSITFVKKVKMKHTSSLHFRVYGLKAVDEVDPADNTKTIKKYYPAILPSGHARISAPQVAMIKDTFDPKHNARYRIRYPWQKDIEDSPWLPVSHEMLYKKSGSVWNLEKGTVVLLDYKDGNVERPYIVGAMQTDTNQASRATLFNNMDLCSPAGHAIRLTDGYGAGAANFIANFNPLVSWCKAWCPDGSAWHTIDDRYEDYKAYEGGMTLTDKYGIYSIKASTDERNISIKSPYGDVNLSAFTGITISAPNGDVTIRGKNVSIEAGNNLSIVSGKNIANGFLGSGVLLGRSINGKAVAMDVGKAFANKGLSYLDISLLRDVLETFVRPVAGELSIKSNRQMKIQAGIDATEFEQQTTEAGTAISNWWKNTVKNEWDSIFDMRSSSSNAWTSAENGQIVVKCKTYSDNENNQQHLLGNNNEKTGFSWHGGNGFVGVWDDILKPVLPILGIAVTFPISLTAIGIYKLIKKKKRLNSPIVIDASDESLDDTGPRATETNGNSTNSSEQPAEPLSEESTIVNQT